MIINFYRLFVRIGKTKLSFLINYFVFISSLLIRSCPSLTSVQRLSINCLPTLIHYHPRYLLSSVDVSSKQYWLAVNDKYNIRLIDSLNLCILNDLSGHTGDIECLAWSPSIDYLLASGSQDKTIRVNFLFSILLIFSFLN